MVEIAQNIAGAIATLHKKGIAHRDIKCANIMVHNSTVTYLYSYPFQLDAKFKAKLGYFGFAKLVHSMGGVATTSVGTFTHMAPEQINSTNYINPFKADIYRYFICLFIERFN